jgi:hypothetical protein
MEDFPAGSCWGFPAGAPASALDVASGPALWCWPGVVRQFAECSAEHGPMLLHLPAGLSTMRSGAASAPTRARGCPPLSGTRTARFRAIEPRTLRRRSSSGRQRRRSPMRRRRSPMRRRGRATQLPMAKAQSCGAAAMRRVATRWAFEPVASQRSAPLRNRSPHASSHPHVSSAALPQHLSAMARP